MPDYDEARVILQALTRRRIAANTIEIVGFPADLSVTVEVIST